MLNYVTGVIGPVIPMTFTLPAARNVQTNKISTVSFILLMNPESLNYGRTNSVQASYTRKGYVIQPWGPNQDMLSAQGKTAAFMTTKEGLTNLGQRGSLAFHNFMALIAAYRNNGYQYFNQMAPAPLGTALSRVINVVPGVRLEYDGDAYLGHFSTFTMDDDASTPFLMNVNFEFIVSCLNGVYRDVRGHFIPMEGTQDDLGGLVPGVTNRTASKLISNCENIDVDAPVKSG